MYVNDMIIKSIEYLNSKIGKQTSLEFYIVGDQLEITCTAYPGRAFEKPREHSVFVPLNESTYNEGLLEEFVEKLGD